MSHLKVLGITGGIASGKSLVAQHFIKRGFTVLDADAIVHELYVEVSVIKAIEAKFPNAFTDHTLNRKALGDIIFSDNTAKKDLEDILHPKVYERLKLELSKHNHEPWVVVDIPLLYETGGESLCDLVLVIHSQEDIQIKRLMDRNALSLEEALKRIHAQMPLKEKINMADIVIDNSGPIQKTLDRVDEIIEKVLI